MTTSKLFDQAAQLRAQLHHHAHLYYVLDAPTLPDAEYDRLFKALQSSVSFTHLTLPTILRV